MFILVQSHGLFLLPLQFDHQSSLVDQSLREAVDELQRALPEGEERSSPPTGWVWQQTSHGFPISTGTPNDSFWGFGMVQRSHCPQVIWSQWASCHLHIPWGSPRFKVHGARMFIFCWIWINWKQGKFREVVYWLLVIFVPPSGSWFFPLNRVGLLQQPSLQFPKIPPVPPASSMKQLMMLMLVLLDIVALPKRRREQYGGTPGCHGCLTGTYQHTAECRARFNELLNKTNLLATWNPGGGMMPMMPMTPDGRLKTFQTG